MQKWMLLVETNASEPSREAEFNKWYNEIHLPDVLETPGIVRAVRYENPNPGDGEAKFLAIYDIETDDIDKTMAALQEVVGAKRKQGRMTDALVRVRRAVLRQISSREA